MRVDAGRVLRGDRDVAVGGDRALRAVVNSIAAVAKLETLFEARTMPPAAPLAP